MARAASPATLVTLVLSDVVGSPLDVIASGPSVPDASTWADAWEWSSVTSSGVHCRLPYSIVCKQVWMVRFSIPPSPVTQFSPTRLRRRRRRQPQRCPCGVPPSTEKWLSGITIDNISRRRSERSSKICRSAGQGGQRKRSPPACTGLSRAGWGDNCHAGQQSRERRSQPGVGASRRYCARWHLTE